MPSRAVLAYTYDSDRNELTIAFASGSAYVYSLVPPTVFAAFEASLSKGAFHNGNIRDRYPYRKVKAAATPLREALIASAELTLASGRSAWRNDGNRGRG